ncbi:hypothetical protein [Kitasatospora sp. MBT63]|uniref:hypothetical protein n=1 Tax=Kitasatospora sp. MBT63 TaxID=1444768 RepID=UPI00053B6E7C|nr:hypothetical protein [Kitasatospora sp. MBT63]
MSTPLSLLPSPHWLASHTDLLAGVLVAVATALLILHRWRKAERTYEDELTMSDEQIAERNLRADARGRRSDDLWTVAVASAAAGLSSNGLRKMGRDLIGLSSPFDWLPFVALDVAAYICGARARRRSRAGQPPGISGALVWVFALISSAFSASEGATLGEAVARAPWPIIAALLFELGSLEERTAARELARRAGDWLDRRIRMVRMLHPIEGIKVALALAADEHLSQADATRRVRIQTAATRLYRVRLMDEQSKDKEPGPQRGSAARGRTRAVRRAQAAQARVALVDQTHILADLERLVRTPDTAGVDFRKRAAVETVLRSFVGEGPGTAEPGTGAHPGTPPVQDSTAGTRGAVPEYKPYPAVPASYLAAGQPGTGTPLPTNPGTEGRTRPAEEPYSGTAEPGTGAYPSTAQPGTAAYPGTAQPGTSVYPTPAVPGTGTPADGVPGMNSQVTAGAPGQDAGTPAAEPGTGAPRPGAPVPAEEVEHEYVPGPDSVYEPDRHACVDHPGTPAPTAQPTGTAAEGEDSGDESEEDGEDDLSRARKLVPYLDADGQLPLSIREVKKLLGVGQIKAKAAMEVAPTLAAETEAESTPAQDSASAVPAAGNRLPAQPKKREYAGAAAAAA